MEQPNTQPPKELELIDTCNKFMVGTTIGRERRVILMNVTPGMRITIPDALNLAAYIVALSGESDLFKRTLEAIEHA